MFDVKFMVRLASHLAARIVIKESKNDFAVILLLAEAHLELQLGLHG
jgi:hypothetical protein